MQKLYFLLILLFSGFLSVVAQQAWNSELVSVSANQKLIYKADLQGNTLPDFSEVGYASGKRKIPDVPVAVIVSPVKGDNLRNIQKAIDQVASLPLNSEGFRGTILLKKGFYPVNGTISINHSGIVVRGEGPGENGTVIKETATNQVDLFEIKGSGSMIRQETGKVAISEEFVPVGRKYVRVADAASFQVGDSVLLFRPGMANWIHDLKMDQIVERPGTKQWEAKDYHLYFERIVTAVDGNTVFLDYPVVMEMDQKYGGGFLMKYSFKGRIRNCGIENLRMESSYQSETDEKHGWNAIYFSKVNQGWVRDVVARYFGQGCVNMDNNTRNITVQNSQSLDAKSEITGGRRYSFSCNGQLNLFKNCFSTEGRHDYVTGSRALGPNVFTRCKSKKAHADIGPHHRWACGTLYDLVETDGEINVQDRGNMGSGHGWAGVTQILWNCRSPKTAVQSPWVSGKNYCIGLIGGKYEGHFSGRPDGVWEGLNKKGLIPESLFEAQLRERMEVKGQEMVKKEY